MAQLELKIVTPRRVVYAERVDLVVVPGVEGELGILPRHTPLVTPLKVGIARIKKDGRLFKAAISGGGFLEATPESATILTDSAELPGDIDVIRARSAYERAEERLRGEFPDLDFERAQAALRRAAVRLQAAGKPHGR